MAGGTPSVLKVRIVSDANNAQASIKATADDFDKLAVSAKRSGDALPDKEIAETDRRMARLGRQTEDLQQEMRQLAAASRQVDGTLPDHELAATARRMKRLARETDKLEDELYELAAAGRAADLGDIELEETRREFARTVRSVNELGNAFRNLGKDTSAGSSGGAGLAGGFTAAENAINGTASAFGSLAKAGGIAGTAIASTVTALLALVGIQVLSWAVQAAGALSRLAGALTILPAAAIGAVGVMGALKLAFLGVGDALDALAKGDMEKFNAELKKMSPALRSIMREVQGLVPEFNKLKNAVQTSFWKQLSGEITKTGEALAGPLKAGLSAIATSLGAIAGDVLKFARNSKTLKSVETVFKNVASALNTLRPGIRSVMRGFADMAEAVSPIFKTMADDINAVAKRFGDWMTKVSKSGDAFAWAQGAWDTLKKLADIGFEVGRALKGIFTGINNASATKDVLGDLASTMRRFADAVNSTDGQNKIAKIVEDLSKLADLAGKLLEITPIILGLANPFAVLAAEVARAGLSFDAFIAAVQGMIVKVISALTGLPEATVRAFLGFEQVPTIVSTNMAEAATAAQTGGTAIVSGIAGGLSGVPAAVATGLGPLTPAVRTAVAQGNSAGSTTAKLLAGMLHSDYGAAAQSGIQGLSPLKPGIQNQVKLANNGGSATALLFRSQLYGAYSKAATGATSGLQPLTPAVTGSVTKASKGGDKAATIGTKEIVAAYKKLPGQTKTALAPLTAAVRGAVTAAMKAGAAAARAGAAEIKGIMSDLASSVSTSLSGISSNVATARTLQTEINTIAREVQTTLEAIQADLRTARQTQANMPATTGGAQATAAPTSTRAVRAAAITVAAPVPEVHVHLNGREIGGFIERIVTRQMAADGARALRGQWA